MSIILVDFCFLSEVWGTCKLLVAFDTKESLYFSVSRIALVSIFKLIVMFKPLVHFSWHCCFPTFLGKVLTRSVGVTVPLLFTCIQMLQIQFSMKHVAAMTLRTNVDHLLTAW